MADSLPAPDLLKRLAALGLPTAFVRRMLPEWLSPEAARTPGGLLELKLLLSRQFDLDANRLLADGEVAFRDPTKRRFKKARSVDTAELFVASSVAMGVAREVAAACTRDPAAIPQTGEAVREACFSAWSTLKWISLEAILNYSWLQGIPVLYLEATPPGNKKMDAMAVRVNGRPVIVVSRRSSHPAWIAFLVAHELGHIARGHVEEGIALIDTALGDDPFASETDQDENEANDYAFALLTGAVGTRYFSKSQNVNAPALLEAAMAEGKKSKVDPGHIILNFGHHTSNWAMAMSALSRLKAVEPKQTINDTMARYIDLDALGEDAQEFVRKATGL
jgi:hypothetical protein